MNFLEDGHPYLYGKLNKEVELLKPKGKETPTTTTEVDDENNIKVNVKDSLLIGDSYINESNELIIESKDKLTAPLVTIQLGDFKQEQSDMAMKDESNETFIKNKSTKYLKNEGEDGSSKYTTEIALNAEVSRATVRENELDTKISDEINRATTVEDKLEANLDTKYDKTGGVISGEVIITGDLTINGTQHINNTENLNVENAMIYSNSNGATLATNGGIGIKTNSTDVYGIVYDPDADSVKLGLGKSDSNGVFTFNTDEGEPIAVRDDSSKLTNNHLIKWDSVNNKLSDSGKSVDDLTTAINLENGTDNVLIQTTDTNHSFKVMTDGRAKVQFAPTEDDDVVRLNELFELTQEQVDLLF